MTELALTRERRSQLATLLEDEQLLRTEYPKVAEYFAMAARLPGPADSQVAAAFDVRLLHYMTDEKSVSMNPYWEIVAPLVFEHDGRRVVNGGQPDGSGLLAFAQMILQAAYSYAIPSPETLEWVTQACGDSPLLELGAGRGYWAVQLSRTGLTVDAFELEPPHTTENISFPRAAGQPDVWYPVKGLDELRIEDQPEHVLFLCWPPGWGNTMASDALAAFESAGGNRLVYIGEPKGGKTSDDAFFDALSARWELESTDRSFVSWWNLADVAECWIRR